MAGTQAGSDIASLQAACDALIAASADPAATCVLLVKVWAAGAAGVDDLLADLADLAAAHAERTGVEPTAAELLEAAGRPQAAATYRHALAQGLWAHERTAAAREQQQEGSRSGAEAARAALRIQQIHEQRRRPRRVGQHAA